MQAYHIQTSENQRQGDNIERIQRENKIKQQNTLPILEKTQTGKVSEIFKLLKEKNLGFYIHQKFPSEVWKKKKYYQTNANGRNSPPADRH